VSAFNETLSHVTLGQVAVVALIIAGVYRFGRGAWDWVRRAVHFVDKLESIEREVLSNGGSSLRDAVDQIGTTQAALARAQEDQAAETHELRSAFEEHVTASRLAFEQHVHDTERAPRRVDDPPEVDYRPTTTT